MRQTSVDIHQGAMNLNNSPFFSYEQNKKTKNKKCRLGIAKCCSVSIVILGMNAFSFYIGYLVSKDGGEDGSYLL
tara:strand:- start:344 stop:568 length:225 start_codon:yes stop_codon:yes gene_type:complete